MYARGECSETVITLPCQPTLSKNVAVRSCDRERHGFTQIYEKFRDIVIHSSLHIVGRRKAGAAGQSDVEQVRKSRRALLTSGACATATSAPAMRMTSSPQAQNRRNKFPGAIIDMSSGLEFFAMLRQRECAMGSFRARFSMQQRAGTTDSHHARAGD